ncbi:MAG TPA: aminomethyl-transferring glycine dehydrogenase [Gemmatimonadales bacterium]
MSPVKKSGAATPRHTTTLPHPDQFLARHLGPRPGDIADMITLLGYGSLDAMIDAIVPQDIRLKKPMALPAARSERDVVADLRAMAASNEVYRSYIGMGYNDTITPGVIQRNVLENPGWYTAYTPYQAEIAQGRLEALLNFQTVVSDLTGLPIANASLLDEGTAAAEAMHLTEATTEHKGPHTYLVDANCHPQTIAVIETRAAVRGVTVVVQEPDQFAFGDGVIGAIVQYPATDGRVRDFAALCDKAHAGKALVTVATDLLALTMLAAPGSWGADVAVGNSQRFGVPMGYGGPHAAFFATKDAYKRHLPGRIIGLSKDSAGRPALRMALQTREQHIRREKATSNVCTAQVLLAVIASMYAVYHGPDGLTAIAKRVHRFTTTLARALAKLKVHVAHDAYFDTLAVDVGGGLRRVLAEAKKRHINLRVLSKTRVGVSLDETTELADVVDLVAVLAPGKRLPVPVAQFAADETPAIPAQLTRTTPFCTHPVFHRHRSETEMLRYIKQLENRDLSLTSAMIPLGSCTMKLNATAEMVAVTFPGFGKLHPFAPTDQTKGYQRLFQELEDWLSEITGFAAVSLQPNAGSQGEFAGLLVIRAYQKAKGEDHRTTCLIPNSAHGTNPASAVMAGLSVVPVKTDAQGNIDVADLEAKALEHQDTLSALMITYPSTHGVFESTVKRVCAIVHQYGGQVYMDGANMNAQVGLCRPGDIGADVCHLNLHKTFCIPHGGGGPGMGPIGVAKHLAAFLPDHPVIPLGKRQSAGTVSAAPWGSSSILPISWAYIAMMGPDGLAEATKVAILNANYIARRLKGHIELLYSGERGLVAHECILDTRPFKQTGIEVEDIAKRIIDYGFHPPTVSFPVAGTLMVEPTESEPKRELDRFCDALIAIREEIREVEQGKADKANNVLTNAPHTQEDVIADDWNRPYAREKAAFPVAGLRAHKSWPTVGRVDGAGGDRNLICTCPPMESYGA